MAEAFAARDCLLWGLHNLWSVCVKETEPPLLASVRPSLSERLCFVASVCLTRSVFQIPRASGPTGAHLSDLTNSLAERDAQQFTGKSIGYIVLLQILRDAGPDGAGLSEIIDGLAERGVKTWEEARIAKSSIASTCGHDPAFMRVGPGTFALRAITHLPEVRSDWIRVQATGMSDPVACSDGGCRHSPAACRRSTSARGPNAVASALMTLVAASS